MKQVTSICIILSYFLLSSVWANVKLPAIISDNMVLQADAKDSVWGWADPNEKVTIKIGSQMLSTTADVQGAWRLVLNPLTAGSGPLEMTIIGKKHYRYSQYSCRPDMARFWTVEYDNADCHKSSGGLAWGN